MCERERDKGWVCACEKERLREGGGLRVREKQSEREVKLRVPFSWPPAPLSPPAPHPSLLPSPFLTGRQRATRGGQAAHGPAARPPAPAHLAVQAGRPGWGYGRQHQPVCYGRLGRRWGALNLAGCSTGYHPSPHNTLDTHTHAHAARRPHLGDPQAVGRPRERRELLWH